MTDKPNSTDRYMALFDTRNTPPSPDAPATTKEAADLSEAGFTGSCKIRDLWMNEDRGEFTGQYAPELPWHGADIFRISGKRTSTTTH